MILPLAISAVAVLITFIIASIQDIKDRSIYRVTWYPAAAIGLICVIIYWADALPENLPVLIISLVFAALMAVFAFFGLFGKADAKALILLSIAVPATPFAAYIFPSLAVSSLVNAGVLVLLFAIICLIYNIARKNRGPLSLMCSGIPVRGDSILKYHGFISEEVTDTEQGIVKTRMKRGAHASALKYQTPVMIKVLREHPDTYAAEIARYAKCDKIWISFGIPLLLPLTIGFILALFGVSVVDIILGLIL